jgi:2-polyprenyl-3-methyl-5-hydroxy-6-metoxy-1,4-benzoquinol methylase
MSAWRRVGFMSGCERCGLLFANPLPGAAELARVYAPDGVWGRTRQHAPERPMARARLRRLFAPISGELDVMQPPPGAAVLDFGCGEGGMLDTLAARGWVTYGLDPSTKVAFPRHHEVMQLPETPQFDLVVVHHVLEHILQPLAILEQLARATRPGGFLMASVPNLDAADVHGDLEYCLRSKTHVLAYTQSCLRWLMAAAGFRVVAAMAVAESRHLVVLARREGGELPKPPAPLEAGRSALTRYFTRFPGDRVSLPWLPVRLRAALAAARILIAGLSRRVLPWP